ncbi:MULTISPECIES: hypothetical protein [Microbulbifer]|uniref:hypothetical protein n=1 Tax=Microbulbifer TaxID=48073 RepID=UPI001E561886|nr:MULTISPECIES: hypothetical protein [Microbulbifer]UHQ55249.1 hypothetical protein LVE68_17330 [Microbulbifer sp. YPW16]
MLQLPGKKVALFGGTMIPAILVSQNVRLISILVILQVANTSGGGAASKKDGWRNPPFSSKYYPWL